MSLEVHISGQNLLPKAQRAQILGKIKAIKKAGEVSLLFVKDPEIQDLNKQWRGKNKPTDVLSFSAQEGAPMPGMENMLGDIVISVDRAKAQADQWKHGFSDEVVILFVHGLMHLLGHDHEQGQQAAQKQAEAEMKLLKEIGLNPQLALCGRTVEKFKMTRPRELILAELSHRSAHMSAEQILALVRKKDPLVSQATVYRTLKLFQEAGLVRAHYFGDGEAVFEMNLDPKEHHDHLICDVCHCIVEFENHEIERLQEVVAAEQGFRLTHHRMELYGVCSNCE
ncbi:MAG: rRNA maturation RNase YbeY [Myxococcaceae bacterium]